LNVSVVSASVEPAPSYGQTLSRNTMTLALPAFWLYSCWPHSTGERVTIETLGVPPPAHGAVVQAANDAARIWAARS
jgi:hypothetical protein